ncbi:hypothetical protein HHL19_26125 [Streptomyces sp. R302]|uniref:hypothetical protein n=1 Tax=unclassified Streptomyces TaxID=2593676 RepID=UPI00145CD5FF|nr:hypothetical protein [Streptomyces sp. R301]NML82038.1 hypothetical protein [Streptomyces sp. R302]
MALHLLCKDPESPNNGSPTLYYDDATDSYLLQSWKVVDASRLASISIPDHETIVEFPTRLLRLFPTTENAPHVRTAREGNNAP